MTPAAHRVFRGGRLLRSSSRLAVHYLRPGHLYDMKGLSMHAWVQMDKSRQAILECIRLCEEAEGDRAIPAECFDEDGELDEQHIFCARCSDSDTNDEVGSCTPVDICP